MSTGQHKIPDEALSKHHIDIAIAALIKAIHVDDKHWIPYLGGYSQDWDQNPEVFFDARFPDSLMVGGKRMQPYRYVLIHESIEKLYMQVLKFAYLPAHYLATCGEKSAVEADGFSWKDYCSAIKPFITKAMKEQRGLQVPQNLDLAPYEETHDTHELSEMEKK